MTDNLKADGKELYLCEACGFHYKEKTQAEKCDAWCKEHKTCSMEITKTSVEMNSDAGNTR